MADFHKQLRQGSTLDYVFDWASTTNGDATVPDWLESGETISNKTVTVESGLTKDSDTLVNTNTSVRVWLNASVAALGTYTVTCSITTSNSRTDDRTLDVEVI